MSRFLSARRDNMIAAIITLSVGVFIVVRAYGYRMGTLDDMGPGYFPMLLGVAMILLSAALPFTPTGDPDAKGGPKADPRGPIMIIAAIVVFAFTIKPFGLIPAVFIVVALSSQATRGVSILQTLALAAGTAIGAYLIFKLGLNLQIKAFG